MNGDKNIMESLKGKKLLILGATRLERDIVDKAHELGVYVAVADYNLDAPAKEHADEKVLIDATDVDALVKYCRENHIDGVTTGFVDPLMPACYEVCRQLGLPYYATPKMLSMSTNKEDFKNTCEEYDIPVPHTVYVGKDVNALLSKKIPYPVFVKPLDASGSRGAAVCYNVDELQKQFLEASGFSKTDSVIVEEYITGTEFLLDYAAVDGEFRLLAMFDRYMCDDRDSARNYANISCAPAKKIDHYLETMNDRVIAMFKDLGFRDGLLFMQGHTEGDRIVFYEMGCRLGGSFYNLEQACIGLNPVEMTIRYALTGKMLEDISKVSTKVSKFSKTAISYNCLLGGTDETISSIKGLEILSDLPSYVTSIQERVIGEHYVKDSIVDKPLITIYLAHEDMGQIRKDIYRLNTEIEAYNEQGMPLLMHRYDPERL